MFWCLYMIIDILASFYKYCHEISNHWKYKHVQMITVISMYPNLHDYTFNHVSLKSSFLHLSVKNVLGINNDDIFFIAV